MRRTILGFLTPPAFASIALVASCSGKIEDAPNAGDDSTLANLTSVNGLSAVNGLALVNGLTSVDDLAARAGLMTSAAGRATMTYLVRCALPSGQSVIKQDQNGTSYTFAGEIGVAPEWEAGTCDTACQEDVSACMLAHVNTSGRHIALWLDGTNPAIGWGRNPNYPYQEGSFFGNIFADTPSAYYCNGKDFDLGVVPGRLGVGQTGAPYTNPFSGAGYCQDNCAAVPAPNAGDGYAACNGYSRVVTVWRNFDPTTKYKICNRGDGQCLDTFLGGTLAGTNIVEGKFSGAASQEWNIAQVSPGNYRLTNVKANQSLDVLGGIPLSGVTTVLFPYHGGSSQMWNFVPTGDGYYEFSPASDLTAALTGGASVVQFAYGGAADQQWSVTPAE